MASKSATEVIRDSLSLIQRDLEKSRDQWTAGIDAMTPAALRAKASVFSALQRDIDEKEKRAAFVKGLLLGAIGLVTGPLAGVLIRKSSAFWKTTRYQDDIVRLNGRLAVLTTKHTTDRASLAHAEAVANLALGKLADKMVNVETKKLPDYKSAVAALEAVAEVEQIVNKLKSDVNAAFDPLIDAIAKQQVEPKVMVSDPALDASIRKRAGNNDRAFVEEVQRQLLDWYLAKRGASNLWNTRLAVNEKTDQRSLALSFEATMWSMWVKTQSRVKRLEGARYGTVIEMGDRMRTIPPPGGFKPGKNVMTYEFDKHVSSAITKVACIKTMGRIDTKAESDALDRYVKNYGEASLFRLEAKKRKAPREFTELLAS
ncbi:MAG: hypothetical protein AAFY56_22000 [Pseudomonadota bacterium]